jgi:FKBP-type peptidyl-prolyl cis-trans isomerase 2
MSTARHGDTVKVHYTGTLDDGTIFDSSSGRDPLEFTIGKQSVIAGFESAVVGLGVGEKKSISIAPEDGYGEYTTDLVATVERSQLPTDLELAPGMVLQGDTPQGPMKFMVTLVEGNDVTLDGNHPLAGKQLNFDLEVVEISSA